MIKLTYYNEKMMTSYEIDGIPHANMQEILDAIVPDGWGDYSQVLNSSQDMLCDLQIKFIDGVWMIPVYNTSSWLYSFSLRNTQGIIYERFRVYRRDYEQALRVTWGMETDYISIKECDILYKEGDRNTPEDLYEIFAEFGVRENELRIQKGTSIISYIEHVVSGTSCGPRGHLLAAMIQYIESLPNGSSILEVIDEDLVSYLPQPDGYLDDYLDTLNAIISLAASRFIGEL